MMRIFVLLVMVVFCFTLPSAAQSNDKTLTDQNKPLKILKRPRPNYTDEARAHNVMGVVKLEVTFLSDGTIGDIRWLSDHTEKEEMLRKYGLVQVSVVAARKIKFEPEIVDGKPVDVTRSVGYPFTIY